MYYKHYGTDNNLLISQTLGSKYWRYTGKAMDEGYPKEINEGFTGIPDNIDAALVWSGNGKIYFFKGRFLNT